MNDINIHNESYAKNHIKFENEIDALLILSMNALDTSDSRILYLFLSFLFNYLLDRI